MSDEKDIQSVPKFTIALVRSILILYRINDGKNKVPVMKIDTTDNYNAVARQFIINVGKTVKSRSFGEFSVNVSPIFEDIDTAIRIEYPPSGHGFCIRNMASDYLPKGFDFTKKLVKEQKSIIDLAFDDYECLIVNCVKGNHLLMLDRDGINLSMISELHYDATMGEVYFIRSSSGAKSPGYNVRDITGIIRLFTFIIFGNLDEI